jgi:hypothetical protein
MTITNSVMAVSTEQEMPLHELFDKWVLWAHLPHDTNWTVQSYTRILGFNTAEDAVAIMERTPEVVIKNCMLFLMRSHINPVWEDPANKGGGCFSFKVPNRSVVTAWRQLCYAIVGGSISTDSEMYGAICGATISPKKAFCIVKIWMTDCAHMNPRVLTTISGLCIDGCIFKKHL